MASSERFFGCPLLSDDHQSHVRNEIKDQKDNLEQPEERVNTHVEGFSGKGKPFALRTHTKSGASIHIVAHRTNRAPFVIVHHIKIEQRRMLAQT